MSPCSSILIIAYHSNLKIGALVQENRRPTFIRKDYIIRLYFKSEEVDRYSIKSNFLITRKELSQTLTFTIENKKCNELRV